MYKKPKWTKQWNYNNFVEVLNNYLSYTDWLLNVFSCSLLYSYQSFMRIQGEKIELQKNIYNRRICVRNSLSEAASPPSYVVFGHFFCLHPSFCLIFCYKCSVQNSYRAVFLCLKFLQILVPKTFSFANLVHLWDWLGYDKRELYCFQK